MLNPFYKEKSTDTRMFPCPACHEIIALGTRSCRYCGIPIDEGTARKLNEQFKRVTDAIASANTFKFSIWGAVILTVASPLYVFTSSRINMRFLLAEVGTLGAIIHAATWLRKYGALETRDPDYPAAVRSMRRALAVWIGALVVQVALLSYAVMTGALRL